MRLLSLIAETGRAAIPDVAARLGMDVRDVAARLAALSTTGLPLIVGVECDPQGIRNALAFAQAWTAQHMASGGYQVPGSGSGGYQVPGSGSGGYQAPGSASGGYPVSDPGSGPHPNTSSGNHPVPPAPGPHPAQTGPSGPHVPPAQPYAPPGAPAQQPAGQDPMLMWGPPGSAGWARGDQQYQGGHQPAAQPQPAPAPLRVGRVGSKLDVECPSGERLAIKLVEVVDPADYLFTAAGHELQDGERAVVVHTEVTNYGPGSYGAVPDEHLELIAKDGTAISKSSVTLSSRPPHRAGIGVGETAGGHTVYVLPDSTELSSVRWRPQPDAEQHTLSWDISDL